MAKNNIPKSKNIVKAGKPANTPKAKMSKASTASGPIVMVSRPNK